MISKEAVKNILLGLLLAVVLTALIAFTKGTQEICEKFDIVITSNTHYLEDNKVEVIDVSPIFAEAIYRAQVGDSISELFK